MLFTDAVPLHDPKARFSGFQQGKTAFKAGEQVELGALPFPVDIVNARECFDASHGWYNPIQRYLPSR
jgi:hypothetical protein